MKRGSKSLKFKRKKSDVKNSSNPEFHKRKWDRLNEVVFHLAAVLKPKGGQHIYVMIECISIIGDQLVIN
jgi:hypothetical protein